MTLSYQIEQTLVAVDRVLAETDPTNAQEAVELGNLANSHEVLTALAAAPPTIGSAWSLIPAVGLANIACPGSNCLELIDSPPSLYKEQCVSGILSTVNPCSEYLDEVQALLGTIAAQLAALGATSAAEVAQTASEGVENIATTSQNVTRPSLGDIWQDSPEWVKYGGVALLALLLIKALK